MENASKSKAFLTLNLPPAYEPSRKHERFHSHCHRLNKNDRPTGDRHWNPRILTFGCHFLQETRRFTMPSMKSRENSPNNSTMRSQGLKHAKTRNHFLYSTTECGGVIGLLLNGSLIINLQNQNREVGDFGRHRCWKLFKVARIFLPESSFASPK